MALTSPQERAARLLGQGSTRREVARELDIHPATLSRWRHVPEFQRAEKLAKSSPQSDDERGRALQLAALDAVDKDGQAAWTVRLAAARELRSKGGGKPEAEADDGYVLPEGLTY